MRNSTKLALGLILLRVAIVWIILACSFSFGLSERTSIVILVENDRVLLNPYAAILVNPERYPQRNFNLAVAFVKFLISEEGQNLIAEFRKDNKTLFIPLAQNLTLANALGFPNQKEEVEWYAAQVMSPAMSLSPLILATTTSTYDSGLLDYVIPFFEQKFNVKVHSISVGSGQAMEIAKRGDADVVLVHSKALEESFVKDGYGVHRVGIMYNDFVIIGPENDPADIKGSTNATEAFMKIAKAGVEGKDFFISRADNSGTHLLELKIWSQLGIQPSGRTNAWYLEAGASMATVLRMSYEKQAYTLTDRGTWLSKRKVLSTSFFDNLHEAIGLIASFDPEIVSITFLSLAVSGTAVLLGSVLGIPLGAFLGLREFKGKQPLLNLINVLSKSIINAFMGLPPILVGLVVYLLLSASGPLAPFQMLYSPSAMIIAQLIMVVPIVIGVTMSAVGSVDKAIRDRALSLGATEWQTTLTVLKEARVGILTAIVVAFGAAISEVGGIMIVGGNIRWYTRVLTTAILYQTELGNIGTAMALGIILLSLAFALNLVLTYLQLRGARR